MYKVVNDGHSVLALIILHLLLAFWFWSWLCEFECKYGYLINTSMKFDYQFHTVVIINIPDSFLMTWMRSTAWRGAKLLFFKKSVEESFL